MNVGPPMAAAIAAVPYASAVKVGLQFKRRFWEEDEQIYGGITYTDLPITNIGYPNTGYFSGGKGVLLGRLHLGPECHGVHRDDSAASGCRRRSSTAARSIRNIARSSTTASRSPGTARPSRWAASACGVRIRAPSTTTICAQIDGRIALAGEHASYIGGWQEGAVTSALDAIGRLHQRAVAQGAKA